MDVYPSTTLPSTGNFSPGLTSIKSKTLTSSIETIFSLPSTSRVAVLGANPISFFIASEVLPLVKVSKYLPKLINVSIVPADSKYNCIA